MGYIRYLRWYLKSVKKITFHAVNSLKYQLIILDLLLHTVSVSYLVDKLMEWLRIWTKLEQKFDYQEWDFLQCWIHSRRPEITDGSWLSSGFVHIF